MMNPLHALAASFLYLFAVFVCYQLSSRWKEGMKLKTVMLLHNFVLWALSLYMAVEVLAHCLSSIIVQEL